MKRIFTLVTLLCVFMGFASAQVPSQSEDVMLQAFYWNSHSETKWSKLSSQADEIGSTFTLVWLPPASAAEFGGSSNMGYHPWQWSNLSSSWGNKSELTALIQALHNKNCKVIADIVINHHAGNNECCSFPTENFGTYGSFTFNASCITKSDECGKGQGGYDYGHGDNPTGNYGAARDLDHNNKTVQDACKAYLQWMKNEIGYDGWRYDFVKGFNGANNKMYNQAAGGYMSVGEYYDASYDEMVNWVKETGYTSMVFDFAFHDAMTKWGGGSDYGKLAWMDGQTPRPAGVCHSPATRKYAVTFVENHDTDEKHTDGNWPYRGDWEKANAVMLAAPGIPCVFWRHWAACKGNIKKMIAARKAAGVHSESDVVVNNTNGYYESTATGKRGKLKCFVGSGWSAPAGYTLACSGSGWAYYTTAEGGTGEQGGGEQGGGTAGSSFFVRINGTTDYALSPVGEVDYQGREQYMASANVKAGQTVSCYDKDNNAEWTICALDPYGAYQNFTMSGTGSSCKMTCTKDGCYNFYIKLAFEDDMIYVEEGTDCSSQGEQGGGGSQGGGEQGGGQGGQTGSIKVGFKAPSSWSSCNAYAWTGSGDAAVQLLGEWPGTAVTKSGDFYYATVSASNFNIIFNNGSDQTGDINGISSDVCYDGSSLNYSTKPVPPTTSCSGGSQGGGEQGGGEQGGGEQGGGSDCGSSDHLWYFKGWVNNADIEGIDSDNVFEGGMANFNFTAEKNYVFVIYQVHGVAGVQYMATAGNVVEGVTHATLSPSGSGKFVIPAGTRKVYLYDNGNNTVEISTQPISGKKLIDACDGGGEQGGGEQGGGEQGGGEQGGGEQGGGTTRAITVKVDPASIPWSGGVSVHAWETDGADLTGEWPGKAMTKDADGWWSYTFNLAGELNVIFNNGLNPGTVQTNNIEGINANTCFSISQETTTDSWGNNVYLFNTVDCTGGSQGGGEQGGGEQGGGEQGGGSDCGSSDHLWYFKGWVNNADIEGIDSDNVFEGGMANFNFTAEKNYVFVIYQVHGVAGVQYMATAGNVVEGVTHATLSPSGSGKFVIPAGTRKVYLYDNGNNTVEISTQPISGKKLIDACATAVAEEKSNASEFAIYPNPVADELNIQSDTEYDSATITNLAGQTMFFTVSNNKIAVGSLAKGLYIIDLVSENGATEKAKFIKK